MLVLDLMLLPRLLAGLAHGSILDVPGIWGEKGFEHSDEFSALILGFRTEMGTRRSYSPFS